MDFCMKFFWTFKTSVQRCLYPLFQNQHTHFLLLYLFWRMSQISGQDQQNGKENTVDYHPSPSEFILRIHPLIFLMTSKEFIYPKYFLNFFSNLYFSKTCISHHGCKNFKFMVLRLLENTFESKNWNCVLMTPSMTLLQVFIIATLGRKKLPISPKESVLKNTFLSRVEEDYRAANMTKIKLARVVVTSFDKFHHLQPLYFWFLFCCIIIYIQATEMWRFFNLTSFIYTKKYSLQE